MLSPAEPEVERVKAWGEMLNLMRSQLDTHLWGALPCGARGGEGESLGWDAELDEVTARHSPLRCSPLRSRRWREWKSGVRCWKWWGHNWCPFQRRRPSGAHSAWSPCWTNPPSRDLFLATWNRTQETNEKSWERLSGLLYHSRKFEQKKSINA